MSSTANRPQKIWKLNHWTNDPKLATSISVIGNPAEIRLSTSDKVFLSVREKGITLSPGLSSSINIQAMEHSLKFGGMLSPLLFPLNLIPVTPFTPLPAQIFSPPLAAMMKTIKDLSLVASTFLGA